MKDRDSVRMVVDLMKETFGSEFATYYNGEPDAIPLVNLPAIVVTQTTDNTVEGQQAEDDVTDQITIKIVLNKRDDFDGDRVNPLNLTETRIRRYMGQRQGVSYEPKSVKGALRSDLLENVTAVAPTINIEYGVNQRVAGPGLADITAEGHATFGIQYSVETY